MAREKLRRGIGVLVESGARNPSLGSQFGNRDLLGWLLRGKFREGTNEARANALEPRIILGAPFCLAQRVLLSGLSGPAGLYTVNFRLK